MIILEVFIALSVLGAAVNGADSSEGGFTHEDRIIGGTQVKQGEFPFYVLLAITHNGYVSNKCGGSIYNKRTILTAAHCLFDSSFEKGGKLIVIPEITVFDFKYEQELSRVWKIYHVERRIPHSQYNASPNYNNDIGVVILDEQLVYTAGIQPIELASTDEIKLVQTATLTGFGKTQTLMHMNDDEVNRLKVAMPIHDKSICEFYWYGDMLDGHVLCVGAPGLSACWGDSGGPLFAQIGGETKQIGLTSAGTHCGSAPVVFTNVGAYKEWIRSQAAPED